MLSLYTIFWDEIGALMGQRDAARSAMICNKSFSFQPPLYLLAGVGGRLIDHRACDMGQCDGRVAII